MYTVMSCSYDVKLPDSGRGAHPNDLPWRTAGCRTPDISDAKDVQNIQAITLPAS